MKLGTSISSLQPQQESSPTTRNLSIFWMHERHKFREHHNSSLPWARELPKSDPERHEFREHHNSSLPWARESPKSNPERHQFRETALIDPSKSANK